MFKKLKEKITEEVKPFKLTQFTQPAATLGSSSLSSEPIDENLTPKDEVPEEFLGNDGFSIVDLQSPTLSPPLARGRFSRQSSMSSLASDASFFPLHDALFGALNAQSDLDVGSEKEDSTSLINSLSKQELCSAYMKLHRRYQKYKGRASDLKLFCEELERDNKKHKTILLECQEKSLRRMAELKEQCILEQRAKAHLEEVLRNDLEEKDHLIKTLHTKIQLLKDSTGTNVCNEMQERVPSVEVDMNSDLEHSKDLLLQSYQGQKTACEYGNKEEAVSQSSNIERKTLKGKIDSLKCYFDEESFLDDKNGEKRNELFSVLSEISEYLSCTATVEDLLNTPTFEQNSQSNGYKTIFNTSDVVQIPCEAEKLVVTLSKNSMQTRSDFAEHELYKLEFDRLSNEQQINNKLIENKQCLIQDLTEQLQVMEKQLQEALSNKQLAADFKLEIERLLNEQQVTNKIIENKECTVQELNKRVEVMESQLEEALSYKQRALESKSEIDRLLSEQQTVNKLIENKQDSIKDLTEQLEVMEKQLQEALSNKQLAADFKLEIERLINEQQVTNKIIENKECTVQELNKRVEVMESQLEEALSYKQRALESKSEIDRLLSEQQTVNKLIENKQDSIKDLTEQLEVMEKQLQEALSNKQLAADFKLEIERLLNEQQVTNKIIENKECTVQELNKRVEVMESQLEEALSYKQKALESKSEIDRLLSEQQTVNKLIENKQDSIKDLTVQLEVMEKQLQEALSNKQQAADFKLEIERLLNEQQVTNKIIENKECTVQELNKRVEVMESQLKEALSYKQIALESKSEIDRLLNEQQVTHKLIENEQCTIQELTKKLDTTENQLQEVLTDKQRTLDTIAGYEPVIEEYKTQVTNMKELLTLKENELKKLEFDINEMKSSDSHDLILSENSKLTEMVTNLQKDALNTKHFICQIIKEIQSSEPMLKQDSKENCQEGKGDCNLENTVHLFAEPDPDLNVDLKSQNDLCKQIQKEFKSLLNLINKKNSNLLQANDSISALRQELEVSDVQNAKINNTVLSLQSELSDTIKKFNNELAEKQIAIDSKNSAVDKLTKDLVSLDADLKKVLQEKSQVCEKVNSLENELKLSKIQLDQMSKDLLSSYTLVEEKDSTIVSITKDLTDLHKELDAVSFQKAETSGIVESLQNELSDLNSQLEQVNVELQSTNKLIEEKDSTIASMSEDFSKICKELEFVSYQKSEVQEKMALVQNEFIDLKAQFQQVSDDLQITHKKLEKKDSEIEELRRNLSNIKEEFKSSLSLKTESNEIINVLQNEISTGKEQIENLTHKLESAHELISEKQLLISSQKESIGTLQTKFDGISHANDELKNVVATLKNNLTELNIQFELISKDLVISRQENNEKDSTITSLSETLHGIREELEETLTEKRKCDVKNNMLCSEFDNLKLEMKELMENFEKGKLEKNELAEELRSSLALIKDKESIIFGLNQEILNLQKHLETLTQEKELMLEGTSCVTIKTESSETDLQAIRSIPEFQCSSLSSDKRSSPHCNFGKSSSHLPKYDNKLEVAEGSRNIALDETNTKGSSHNVFEHNQKGHEEIHVQYHQEMMELRENSALDFPDNNKKDHHAEFVNQSKFEVPSIKNVILEIQNQSKEYGVLLEQHKQIIKHLEDISNLCNSTVEKDNYSWLQNQLMTLNQMYFTTMEKQNLQSANLNKLLKLQDITIKPLISDNNQTIEMQYLRNIVFQYMIGKETTLLAKVISAIMKFDQKQMDQVMQKEQQKQTLFGQLGLL